MMPMKKIVAAMLGGVALSPAAFAQEADGPKYYWWAGYGAGEYEHDAGNEVRLGTLQGKLGWRLHRNFAVEGEAAFGVDEDRAFLTEVSVSNQYGAYAVGYVPLAETIEVFGRVGYTQVQLDSTAVAAGDLSSTGVGYGAGAVWYVGPLDVRFEYTRYEVDNKADATMISIGSRF
jgi:hypothetical protein